jgi:hypothetical protein
MNGQHPDAMASRSCANPWKMASHGDEVANTLHLNVLAVLAALNHFAQTLGWLTTAVPYEQVVATCFQPLWRGEP